MTRFWVVAWGYHLGTVPAVHRYGICASRNRDFGTCCFHIPAVAFVLGCPQCWVHHMPLQDCEVWSLYLCTCSPQSSSSFSQHWRLGPWNKEETTCIETLGMSWWRRFVALGFARPFSLLLLPDDVVWRSEIFPKRLPLCIPYMIT